MIRCSQCGFDNLPGHLYCAQCKSKLDLRQITREYFFKVPINGRPLRQILLGALALAVLLLALAFWPQSLAPVNAADAAAGPARRKLMALQQTPAGAVAEFSEKEVNLLFNFLIQENNRRPGQAAGGATLQAGYIEIQPAALIIRLGYQWGPWLIGPLTVGPYRLTCALRGVPEKKRAGLDLAVRGGAIGHLPGPALGGRLAYAGLQRLFRPFKNMRLLLGKLEIVEMKKGRITVSAGR